MTRLANMFLYFTSILIFILFSCEKNSTNPALSNKIPKHKQSKHTINDSIFFNGINSAQRELAQALAIALTEEEVRTKIYEHVGLKFDGDFDVLYNTIATAYLQSGATFRERLVYGLMTFKSRMGIYLELEAANGLLDSLTGRIQKLQIAVPTKYANWDAESYIPLVTYMPFGIEDSLIDSVQAYDSNGNVYWLSALDEPDYPVIVIGVNERTNINGDVTYCDALSTGGETGGGSGGSGTQYDRVYINDFRLMDDHEPWTSGDPEIYVKTKRYNYSENWRRTDFSHVNDERWYYDQDHSWLPKEIYSLSINTTAEQIQVEVWEDDDTSSDDKLETVWWFAGWLNIRTNPPWQSHFDFSRSHGYTNRALYEGVNCDADVWMYWQTQ
jgi:hypothetical protein